MGEFNAEAAGGLRINPHSDWIPQCDVRVMDCAHRIGQKKQVFGYFLERTRFKLPLDATMIQKQNKKS